MTVTGRWAREEIDLIPREHPAKFSTSIMNAIDHIITEEAEKLGRRLRILDGFAGTGRIHRLREAGHHTFAIELEPEWAIHALEAHPGFSGPMIVGDSTRPPIRDGSMDAIVESPCYGNRMADHHENHDACNHTVKRKGKDPIVYPLISCPKCKGTGLSERNTYRHKLRRLPTRGSSAVMEWGPAYRDLHARHYEAMLPLLRPRTVGDPGGMLVVNISNHMKTLVKGGDPVEMRVSEWHVNELMAQGCNIDHIRRPSTPRNGNGANGDVRVDGELVVVMRRGS